MLRFIPNLDTGELHIGHIVTYTINRFAALQIQEKGIKGIKDEKGNLPNIILAGDTVNLCHNDINFGVQAKWQKKIIEKNLFLIEKFFSLQTTVLRVPTWHEAKLLQIATNFKHHAKFKEKDSFMANTLINQDHFNETIFNTLMKIPLFDALIGTNCFVRGRDLKREKDIVLIEQQMKYFAAMADREYLEFWTPLVILDDGTKIAKSGQEVAGLYRLYKQGISPATFFVYAIYKLFNDKLPDLLNLWERFDLEEVVEVPDWIFHEEELLELDKWVKKQWDYKSSDCDFWSTCSQSIK